MKNSPRIRRRVCRIQLEELESKSLLAAGLAITEFMASNHGGLRDGDGSASDWIEIANTSDAAIDLAGYRLTDRASDRSRWPFPSIQLDPAQHLVVYASGQDIDDYVDAAGNLHTNFALSADGEYLALVAPDGTVVSEYGSGGVDYPPQWPNVSYGTAEQVRLADANSDIFYAIPGDDSVDRIWMNRDFDAEAHGFARGKAAVGYESRPGDRTNFVDQIQTPLPARTHGAYVRLPFELHDASAVTDLVLRLKYDDGVVAYLNGTKVVEENAPTVLGWFSTAPAIQHGDADAAQFADFDLGDERGNLVDGTNVLALHVLNNLADDSDLLLAVELVAGVSDMQAATGMPAPVGYLGTPTPGSPNVSSAEVYSGVTASARFSVAHGIYEQPLSVEISTDTTGATIRYTTDGSQPSETHGSIYSGPIRVDRTTPLRAVALRSGWLSSQVNTQTYLLMDHPVNYLGQSQPAYPDHVQEALFTLPTMSLAMRAGDFETVRDRGSGAIGSSGENAPWERPVSVELIYPSDYPDAGAGFQINAGVRPHSWTGTAKRSLKLLFKSQYGSSRLEYPLFESSPRNADNAVADFDKIILRANSNDGWESRWGGSDTAIYIRDQFARDLQMDMGGIGSHGTFVHLYINGEYWGVYNPVERPDQDFLASYLGGDDSDYFAMNHGGTISGDPTIYDTMHRIARTANLSVESEYERFQQYLDVEQFADYLLASWYASNPSWDWPINSGRPQNFYAGNRTNPPGGVQHFIWDSEFTFIWDAAVHENFRPNSANRNELFMAVWFALVRNDDFMTLFADRAYRHLFHDGALSVASSKHRLNAWADFVRSAVTGAEAWRWGAMGDWEANFNIALDRAATNPENLLASLRQYGYYPDIDPPEFNQHGGVVSPEFPVELSGTEGTIYYTIDGSDPRRNGGAVSSGANEFVEPLRIGRQTTIKTRLFRDGTWSALNEATFLPASEFPLRITEINHDPYPANVVASLHERDVSSDHFQFVELTNTGQGPIDLAGVQLVRPQLDGEGQTVVFTFATQTLGPGELTVVVRDRQAFLSRYGTDVPLAAGHDGQGGPEGQYAGVLSPFEQPLTLLDATGSAIQRFTFDSTGDWPTRAAGRGSSLEVIDAQANYSDPDNWRASSRFGGSPGTDADPAAPTVVINEVLAHSDPARGDQIELANTTGHDIDVTGWFLSNREDQFFQHPITGPKVIPALGYQVVTESELGLPLDGVHGDQLWLISMDSMGRPLRFEDRVQFGPSMAGVSVGPSPVPGSRWSLLAEPTLGQPNGPPRVGDVVISELHYRPRDLDGTQGGSADDLEFIELYNRTDEPVDIGRWQLAGSIDYRFASGTVLGGGRSLVVVGFDPRDLVAGVFRLRLGMHGSATMVGPYGGQFDDAAGLVQLVRPGELPAGDAGSVPWLTVDEVRYSSELPWPPGAAGGGDSLTRTQPSDYGLLPTSWRAKTPSPGSVDFLARQMGDANEDGRFDELDLESILQAGKYRSGRSAGWWEGDFNGDGRFDPRDLVAALQRSNGIEGPRN